MAYLVGMLILIQSALCAAPPVRVALRSLGTLCALLQLKGEGGLSIRGLSPGADPEGMQAQGEWTVKASESGVEIGNGTRILRDAKGFRVETSTEGILCISGAGKSPGKYRGALEFRRAKAAPALAVVNELDLEDYLASVVPSEMPANFQAEALKAQAVAARSWTASHRGKHAAEQADLCDMTDCQLYRGAGAEKASSTAAVVATRGIVARWAGKPIQALYCADCGGYTASCEGSDTPYLAATRDSPGDGVADYCKAGPKHTWSLDLDPVRLADALSRLPNGRIGTPKSLLIEKSDIGGRITKLRITGETGEIELAGEAFRRLLGTALLRSARFTVTDTEGGGWKLQGFGSGHGMGMCQIGANGLAGPPYNLGYVEILQHYYRGVEVKPLPE